MTGSVCDLCGIAYVATHHADAHRCVCQRCRNIMARVDRSPLIITGRKAAWRIDRNGWSVA